MKWAKCLAAAAVLTLGVFVSAIPPASIEARAQAAPIATDEPGVQGAGDDDSDALAQQQEDAQWQEQQEQDDEQAQQQLQDSLQQMEQSEQEAEQQNEAAEQQTQLDEQLAQSNGQQFGQ
jgi:phage-related protein